MKLKLLVVAVCAVALGVSGAIAAPPPGKGKPENTGKPETTGKPATAGKPETAGKPPTTGALCRPKVTVVLKGTITSTSINLLGIDVTRANWWGRSWATLGTASVAVDDSTKVRRNGQKLLSDLAVGDWVLVQARACKADLKAGTPPELTVVRVVAHPAKA
jgi:hypothetical protein